MLLWLLYKYTTITLYYFIAVTYKMRRYHFMFRLLPFSILPQIPLAKYHSSGFSYPDSVASLRAASSPASPKQGTERAVFSSLLCCLLSNLQGFGAGFGISLLWLCKIASLLSKRHTHSDIILAAVNIRHTSYVFFFLAL